MNHNLKILAVFSLLFTGTLTFAATYDGLISDAGVENWQFGISPTGAKVNSALAGDPSWKILNDTTSQEFTHNLPNGSKVVKAEESSDGILKSLYTRTQNDNPDDPSSKVNLQQRFTFNYDGSLASYTKCDVSSVQHWLYRGGDMSCTTVTPKICNAIKRAIGGKTLNELNEQVKQCRNILDKIKDVTKDESYQKTALDNRTYIVGQNKVNRPATVDVFGVEAAKTPEAASLKQGPIGAFSLVEQCAAKFQSGQPWIKDSGAKLIDAFGPKTGKH